MQPPSPALLYMSLHATVVQLSGLLIQKQETIFPIGLPKS